MYIILCGGSERDTVPGTFPRPLNQIYGYPQLHHSLRDLAPTCGSFLFVYSVSLKAHYFEETVRGLFPGVVCYFAVTYFATRGPVETALAGLLQTKISDGEPIVFLDNDNHYPPSLVPTITNCKMGAFVGYDEHQGSQPLGEEERLAYLTLREESGTLANIEEKKRISNKYAVGVYGFSSAAEFVQWARYSLEKGPFMWGSLYFSSVYRNMIAEGMHVGALRLSLFSLDRRTNRRKCNHGRCR